MWLIYVLVMWWTGFPKAFAAATTTLFTPLMLALAGIVLRGAGFAFRKYAATFGQARLFGAMFAGSSLITPFFFGTVAGAIASGRVPAAGYGDPVSSWVNPTSLVGGCLAVTTCIFLAGVFLTVDAVRGGEAELAARLRVRTIGVGVVAGLVVFAGLYPVLHDAPTLSHGLTHQALPLLVVAALAGLGTLVLLVRGFQPMRALAVAGPGMCRRRGDRGGRRLGGGSVPVAAGRPVPHRRRRRCDADAGGAAGRRRAGRGGGAAGAQLPAVVHPDRRTASHTAGGGESVLSAPRSCARCAPPAPRSPAHRGSHLPATTRRRSARPPTAAPRPRRLRCRSTCGATQSRLRRVPPLT